MRLVAKDSITGKMVNVTLRSKDSVDLTDTQISSPAYTHIGRATVSGRLKLKSGKYIFERVS